MGITQSNATNNHEFEEEKFSELYKACLEDDADLVRTILTTLPYEKMNSCELNGSTALHIAVECGHTNIVRLLLHDFEVLRHLRDNQGRTAYEMAQTDDIRGLFQRPTSHGNRFCDETSCSTRFTFNEVDENQTPPSGRVQGYQDFISIRNHHAEEVHPYYNNFFKNLSNRIFPYQPGNDTEITNQTEVLLTIIDKHIELTKNQYQKAKYLIKQFYETGRIEPLLRLYTLETPFYGYINQDKQSSDCLSLPIYNGLRLLHPRAFEGLCYRGLAITAEELKAYQWAENKPNRYLVINNFCSTTRDMLLAQDYAQAREHNERKPAVMVFEFTKRCLTAIQLEKLSEQLPAISDMEDEQEIIILPRTTFYITHIEQDLSMTVIHLQCCNLDWEVSQFFNNLAYNISTYN